MSSPVLFIVNSSSYDTKRLSNFNNLFIISVEGHQQDLPSISKCISNFVGILRRGKTILWINYIVRTPFKDTAPYFEYMWTKKILDVVAIFDSESASNQVFTYNPFPTLKVENISGQRDIFPDKLENLHGFPITTLIKRDEPRIFRYKDYNGRTKLGGYAAKIFLAFLKKHNATLEEYLMPNTTYLNIEALINLLSDGNVSISIHPYAQAGLPTDGSYPIGFMDECIMVPAPQEIIPSKYLLVSFPSQVWMLLFVTAILTLTQNLYLNKFMAGKFELGLTLLDIVSGLAVQPFGSGAGNNSWRQRCVRISVVIFGFFIANIYGSRLASAFITKMFQPPLETKEDMIRAKLKILMIQVEFEFLRNTIQPQEFRDLIVPAKVDVVNAYRMFFNNSYGYAVPDDKALFFLLKQKYLKRRLVLYTKVCLATMHVGFNMPRDSPFKDIFSRVLLQTFQSGLYLKWYEDAFDEAVEAGIFTRQITDENMATPISVAHLTLAWTILFCGLSCSLLWFLIEITSKKYLLHAFNNLRRKHNLP
ncbi:unnamed protein product [Hermetia illucens]|uniref:Uncharacterized protein n=1 Tax=Hermetia illucens TaxID=343691 RepID=A0A7R8YM16_HERIL|nr:uncharacterized protein LOC119646710 [Hermetia illucens]CAD7076992.1 unnamed protein product [Hermetia illucens]